VCNAVAYTIIGVFFMLIFIINTPITLEGFFCYRNLRLATISYEGPVISHTLYCIHISRWSTLSLQYVINVNI